MKALASCVLLLNSRLGVMCRLSLLLVLSFFQGVFSKFFGFRPSTQKNPQHLQIPIDLNTASHAGASWDFRRLACKGTREGSTFIPCTNCRKSQEVPGFEEDLNMHENLQTDMHENLLQVMWVSSLNRKLMVMIVSSTVSLLCQKKKYYRTENLFLHLICFTEPKHSFTYDLFPTKCFFC